jgi:predicted GNAT family N-acyltransferase
MGSTQSNTSEIDNASDNDEETFGNTSEVDITSDHEKLDEERADNIENIKTLDNIDRETLDNIDRETLDNTDSTSQADDTNEIREIIKEKNKNVIKKIEEVLSEEDEEELEKIGRIIKEEEQRGKNKIIKDELVDRKSAVRTNYASEEDKEKDLFEEESNNKNKDYFVGFKELNNVI